MTARRLTASERRQAREFAMAARYQRLCARCGKNGLYEAHHVIEAQYLRINGHPAYDPRNALRLCPACHHRHTVRADPLPLTCLTDENFHYAFDLLGEKAEGYLRTHYAGEDPRLERLIWQPSHS